MLSLKFTFQIERHKQDVSQGWKKIYHTNSNNQSAEVAVLISDEIDYKTKSFTEEHLIIIKGSVY